MTAEVLSANAILYEISAERFRKLNKFEGEPMLLEAIE